jgi:hypothetical protein
MTRLPLIAWCALLASSCASLPASPSPALTAYSILELREKAGMYPGDWAVSGASHAPQLARLEDWAAQEGMLVLTARLTPKQLLGHVSYSRFLGWVILLNRDLSPNNRLYTLLHELGHVYAPEGIGTDAQEVFAEMVSASVCERLGLNVWPQTTAYLAHQVEREVRARTVQRYNAQIDRIVVKLTKAAQTPPN